MVRSERGGEARDQRDQRRPDLPRWVRAMDEGYTMSGEICANLRAAFHSAVHLLAPASACFGVELQARSKSVTAAAVLALDQHISAHRRKPWGQRARDLVTVEHHAGANAGELAELCWQGSTDQIVVSQRK